MLELLLPPLVFAVLANLVSPYGRPWLAAIAIAWVAVLSARILASVPGPEVPLHSFERTPVPELLAVLAATLAATVFVSTQRRKRNLPVRVLVTAGVYLLVFVPVGLAVFFWYMG